MYTGFYNILEVKILPNSEHGLAFPLHILAPFSVAKFKAHFYDSSTVFFNKVP